MEAGFGMRSGFSSDVEDPSLADSSPKSFAMTIVVFGRPPLPDMPYGPGRRWLGVVDALAWPAAGAWVLTHALTRSLFVPVIGALLFLTALARARTALVANHRYRFTTWGIARVVFVLLVPGVALKLAM